MWTAVLYAIQGLLLLGIGLLAIALLGLGVLMVQDLFAEWRRGR